MFFCTVKWLYLQWRMITSKGHIQMTPVPYQRFLHFSLFFTLPYTKLQIVLFYGPLTSWRRFCVQDLSLIRQRQSPTPQLGSIVRLSSPLAYFAIVLIQNKQYRLVLERVSYGLVHKTALQRRIAKICDCFDSCLEGKCLITVAGFYDATSLRSFVYKP
jgi:hypothetical protein